MFPLVFIPSLSFLNPQTRTPWQHIDEHPVKREKEMGAHRADAAAAWHFYHVKDAERICDSCLGGKQI